LHLVGFSFFILRLVEILAYVRAGGEFDELFINFSPASTIWHQMVTTDYPDVMVKLTQWRQLLQV
jgi:hypothetical protein